jgi:hypothetical protein
VVKVMVPLEAVIKLAVSDCVDPQLESIAVIDEKPEMIVPPVSPPALV